MSFFVFNYYNGATYTFMACHLIPQSPVVTAPAPSAMLITPNLLATARPNIPQSPPFSLFVNTFTRDLPAFHLLTTRRRLFVMTGGLGSGNDEAPDGM